MVWDERRERNRAKQVVKGLWGPRMVHIWVLDHGAWEGSDDSNAGMTRFLGASILSCHNKRKGSMGMYHRSSGINSKNRYVNFWRKA